MSPRSGNTACLLVICILASKTERGALSHMVRAPVDSQAASRDTGQVTARPEAGAWETLHSGELPSHQSPAQCRGQGQLASTARGGRFPDAP